MLLRNYVCDPLLLSTRQHEEGKLNPEDPSHLLGDWNLSGLGLSALPESICSLKIDGNLDLQHNEITHLPDGFASITVRGGIYLNDNRIESLPDDFSSLENCRFVMLYNNPVANQRPLPDVGSVTCVFQFPQFGN